MPVGNDFPVIHSNRAAVEIDVLGFSLVARDVDALNALRFFTEVPRQFQATGLARDIALPSATELSAFPNIST